MASLLASASFGTFTPTDRPKSVRNSCVIKVFGGVFMLSRCFLDCSVGVGVFVTGLSQISSFFSFVTSLFNFLNYFVWLRITDEGSLTEIRIWSILLIKSNLKWCINLGLFLYSNYFTHLVSVTAGGPESP